MWYTIENFHQPTTLSQAVELYQFPKRIFISGGSYLMSNPDTRVESLINIRHLVGNKIYRSHHEIILEAGATEQEIVEQFPNTILGKSAQDSCFSKNIRNQRTLGGEIAQKRLQSDLYTILYTINGRLHVFTHNEQQIAMKDWSGKGIITQLIVDTEKMEKVRFFRYTIMPSASPFLMVSALPEMDGWKIVVSGKAKSIQEISLPYQKLQEENIFEISQQLSQSFENDQYGTLSYKSYLIGLSLKELKK